MSTDALIVGYGEVGRALCRVLRKVYDVRVLDPPLGLDAHKDPDSLSFMHVCFPYSDSFVESVLDYRAHFQPAHTVIHSSVPVGTSRVCGAFHSPVIGKHPRLEESLVTFTKFVGGNNPEPVLIHLQRAGMTCYPYPDQETTEVVKLLSTALYGLLIEFTKEAEAHCDDAFTPFAAWTLWNQAYNEGYAKLGHPEYTRPQLIPMAGKIGGTCVLPNCELLGGKVAQFVLDRNRDQGEG